MTGQERIVVDADVLAGKPVVRGTGLVVEFHRPAGKEVDGSRQSSSWRKKMIRPTEVEARGSFRIWLRYSDGTAGVVDLAHLDGRGVFDAWNDGSCFEAVYITLAGGIAWGQGIELCPDALYIQLTSKSVGPECDAGHCQ